MRARRRAFTLIELLILVAIIAILAAIAVPNFLEAQIRSKVAAARDEMHTLAAALEAYWIDQRAYPPNLVKMTVMPPSPLAQPGSPGPRRIEIASGRWLCETAQSVALRVGPVAGGFAQDCPVVYNGVALIRLTTPVAYVGSLPIDRFFSWGWGSTWIYSRPPAIWGPSTSSSLPWSLGDMRPYGYFNFTEIELEGVPIEAFGRTVTYVVTSFGPDVRSYFTDPTIAFPAIYDPTNGAVSYGDLVLPGSQ
jgi:prepilin-type N-terminal cleavage/methylation domain-containing protein